MTIMLIFVLLLLYMFVLGLIITGYVLTSIGLYTLAKRRGIKYPGLAWVPVASNWIVGSLADEVDSHSGVCRNWRKVLIIMAVVVTGGMLFAYALLVFVGLVSAFVITMQEIFTVFMVLSYVLLIPLSIVSAAQGIIRAICIFKIFESTVPDKAVKYLLLSLMVPLAQGICLNKCKKLGYPQHIFNAMNGAEYYNNQQ